MKHLQETMKHFQVTAERLSKLGLDSEQPWKMLTHMNELLDGEFWENMAVLNKYADRKWSEPAQEQEVKEVVKEVDVKKQFVPNVDIFKTASLVIVCCEIAGFDRESLDVKFTDERTMLITGIVREHAYAHARSTKERSYGKFKRQVKLPVRVNPKKMKVQYQDGLLELRFVRIGKPQVKKDNTK